MTQPQQTPPGWYPDPSGTMRWWDGQQWTQIPPPPPRPAPSPHASAPTPVPVQPDVRQARDRAQYTRPQTGHSIIKHIFLGLFGLYIPTIYYALSPNHYFHL